MNLNQEICKSFGLAATRYTAAAKVQHEIGERLFERLSYLKINPQYVLDLGCGPGLLTERLRQQYPQAVVIGLDLTYDMLREAQSCTGLSHLIQADMHALPFAAQTFDLIFANQVVHWSPSFDVLLQSLYRVLRQDGCLMFSTLGPDTMHEVRSAFATVDQWSHTHDFIDMHDRGDALLAQQFLDPVVDMERLTLHYANLPSLLASLKAQGVRNIHSKRRAGLMSKQAFARFQAAMLAQQTPEGKIPLTYEVIYGHAWKGREKLLQQGDETFFSLDQLRRMVLGRP